MDASANANDRLVLTFTGDDLVIPHAKLEELGVKPGERVTLEIKPKIRLKRREFAPGERERLEKILDELAGSWTDEDVEAFYRNREEMWSTWTPRDWS
ncbi:MAG: hypothetical protein ACT4QE_14580 [Anaerolineales bacterium]